MRFLLAFLLLASTASAATLTTESGVLATAQAATGASANDVDLSSDARGSLWITVTDSGTTTYSIQQSSDGGATWGIVTFDASASSSLTYADTTATVRSTHVDAPTGKYRINVTTCTACSMSAVYRMGPSLH